MRRPFSEIWRANEGIAALEFAIVGPILLSFILAMFEIAMIYTQRELLDRAVLNATKQVYIGAATNGTVTKEQLKTAICDDLIMAGSDCSANLTLELQTISSLRNRPLTDATCRDSNLPLSPVVTYDPGQQNSFVFMRVCYMMDLMMPGIRYVAQLPTANGKLALISGSAFRNEPF